MREESKGTVVKLSLASLCTKKELSVCLCSRDLPLLCLDTSGYINTEQHLLIFLQVSICTSVNSFCLLEAKWSEIKDLECTLFNFVCVFSGYAACHDFECISEESVVVSSANWSVKNFQQQIIFWYFDEKSFCVE